MNVKFTVRVKNCWWDNNSRVRWEEHDGYFLSRVFAIDGDDFLVYKPDYPDKGFMWVSSQLRYEPSDENIPEPAVTLVEVLE